MSESKDWVSKPLGEVAALRRGLTYSKDQLSEEDDTGVAYINMKSFKKGGGYNPSGLKFFSGFFINEDLVNQNDLLIANTDVTLDGDIVGVPAYLPEVLQDKKILFSHHVTRLRLDKSISPLFLSYLFNIYKYRRWMLKYARGTTVLMLDMQGIKRIPIIYPDNRHEQQKIATILTSIDTAIEKTAALIQKYQLIKAGLMHDLFTRGVTADGTLRPPREQAPELYQETAIGWIPKDWSYEKLDDFTIRGSGHTPNKSYPEYWNGNVKWVSLADSYRLDKLYISDTEYKITEQGLQNSSACIHPAGIVVMSRDAGVGKSAITTEPMAVSQHFMCWKCTEKTDKYFLYYWLQYKKKMFENIAIGSTIVTIGLPYFKKLKITVPEKNEQEIIGQRLKTIDETLFILKSNLDKMSMQKQGLMQDLLTGKVQVKV